MVGLIKKIQITNWPSFKSPQLCKFDINISYVLAQNSEESYKLFLIIRIWKPGFRIFSPLANRQSRHLRFLRTLVGYMNENSTGDMHNVNVEFV
jgi:hypothetical protein